MVRSREHWYRKKASILIPPNVVLIESDAFRNCFNLTDVVFSGRDTNMERGVFYDCTNLVHVELPDNMEIVDSILKNLIPY